MFPLTVADRGFPVGGAPTSWGGTDSQGGYISKNLYVKMKESGPLGVHAGSTPRIRQCLRHLYKLPCKCTSNVYCTRGCIYIVQHWRIQGGCQHAPPSQAARFFHFYILIFHNIAASDLGTPLTGSTAPFGKSRIRHCVTGT